MDEYQADIKTREIIPGVALRTFIIVGFS